MQRAAKWKTGSVLDKHHKKKHAGIPKSFSSDELIKIYTREERKKKNTKKKKATQKKKKKDEPLKKSDLKILESRKRARENLYYSDDESATSEYDPDEESDVESDPDLVVQFAKHIIWCISFFQCNHITISTSANR